MNFHLRGVKYNEEKTNNNRKLENLMVQWFKESLNLKILYLVH